MTDEGNRRPQGQRDVSGRGRIVALVVVVVLAGALVLIGQAIVRHDALQNCIDSGRRDCDARLAPS